MDVLKVEKRPDGKLKVKGLKIWSTGRFRGYGSPKEGDQFTPADLDAMVQTHKEIGSRLDPRMYPGHPVMPTLKLFTRPKGQITEVYRDGEFLRADLDNVDPKFWNEAKEDNARFSPDVAFNYLDPATGKTYPLAVVGLGVLGAANPANTRLPALGQYEQHMYAARTRAYGGAEVRSYLFDSQLRPLDLTGGLGNPKEAIMPVEKTIEDLQQTVENAIAEEAKELEALKAAQAKQDESLRSFAAQLDTLSETIKAKEGELAEKDKRIAYLEAALEAQLMQQHEGETRAFVDGLVAEFKLAPAQKELAETILKAAAGVEGQVKSYALGDTGEHGETALYGLVKDFLSGLPSQKPAAAEKDFKRAQKSGKEADVRGYATDPEASAALREQVGEYMNANKGVSYVEAMKAVLAGK